MLKFKEFKKIKLNYNKEISQFQDDIELKSMLFHIHKNSDAISKTFINHAEINYYSVLLNLANIASIEKSFNNEYSKNITELLLKALNIKDIAIQKNDCKNSDEIQHYCLLLFALEKTEKLINVYSVLFDTVLKNNVKQVLQIIEKIVSHKIMQQELTRLKESMINSLYS